MIYAGILAGGIGSRMNNSSMPKQFLPIEDKPIIIHTIEKFMMIKRIDKIIIGVNSEWYDYCNDILKKYEIDFDKVVVVNGGLDRNSTILNIINFIDEQFGINDEDIILTHDAVRPFVTIRIIEDNIDVALKNKVCDTVINANDTIITSLNNETITDIPNRSYIYQGQTPQSFNINLFKECFNKLDTDQKNILTDACKVFLLNNQEIYLVKGEVYNFKITTQFDYLVAKLMIGDRKNDKLCI